MGLLLFGTEKEKVSPLGTVDNKDIYNTDNQLDATISVYK